EDDIPALYPCRGHYFSYQAKAPFRHLIYPLPEANMAGLGIHATLDLGGQVRLGPDTQYLAAGQLDDYRVDAAHASRFAVAIRAYYPLLEPAGLHPEYAVVRPKLHAARQPAADFCLLHRQQAAAVVHVLGMERLGL